MTNKPVKWITLKHKLKIPVYEGQSINEAIKNNIKPKNQVGVLKEEIEEPVSQHKKGNKVDITAQAINKVKVLKIEGLGVSHCLNIQKMNKELLEYAMKHNNSNEVGCVYDITTGKKCNFVKGDQTSLELRSDTEINHKYNTNKPRTLVVTHNHPGLSNFSINDINEFLKEESIKTMMVVKNNGSSIFISKKKEFNRQNIIKEYKMLYEKYAAKGREDKFVTEFLKKAEKSGIQKG